MEWFKSILPTRETNKSNNTEYLLMDDTYIMLIREEELDKDWVDRYTTT
jgi:hypothetical protein